MKQYVWFCLQENHQIRRRDLDVEELKDLLVQSQLMVIQIQRSEYPIFSKEVIAKGNLVEQIELRNLLLLLETVQQEEDLGLEGIFFPVLIEIREKRVLVRFFKDTPGIELLCQKPRQTRFANSDRTFYHDISEHDSIHSCILITKAWLLVNETLRRDKTLNSKHLPARSPASRSLVEGRRFGEGRRNPEFRQLTLYVLARSVA